MNTIGERLRELRGGLMQGHVAEKIGLPKSTYCAIENGKRIPKADAIIALAKFHGVTTDYILGLEDKPKGEQEDKHAIHNAVPISANEFFGNMQEMLGLEQKAQEQKKDGEVLAAIVNNMGQMTALQNTLTELWIEQEERIKSLENNFKAMAKALNGIGKIWD